MWNNGVSTLMTHSQKRIEDRIVFLQKRPLLRVLSNLIGKLQLPAVIAPQIFHQNISATISEGLVTCDFLQAFLPTVTVKESGTLIEVGHSDKITFGLTRRA